MAEHIAGRYRLDDPIGSGGMAEVWRATDTRSGATVAVKRLHPGLAADRVARARFRREVESARAIAHPAAVRILDADPDADVPWLAMEHLAGGSLADRLRDGALDPGETLRIGAHVASALASLHAAGLVHRDVTPSNILLPADGGARLGDFGIARDWDGSGAEDITLTGDLVGTIRFVAPEVLAGQPATPAADVWALGAVLHEALTGRRPFDASSPAALMGSQLRPPAAPASAGDASPLIDSMLDPDPSRRPTAAAAAEALRDAADSLGDGDERTTVIDAGTVAFASAVSSRAVAADSAPAPAPRHPGEHAAGPGVRPAVTAPAASATPVSPMLLLVAVLLLAVVVLGSAVAGRQTTTGAPDAANPATLDANPTATPPPSPSADAPAAGGHDGGSSNGGAKGRGNANGHDKGNGNGKGKGNE